MLFYCVTHTSCTGR